MASIYNLSWDETSFFAKLQLFLKSLKEADKKIRSANPGTQAEGYSAISSTCYSIVGTASAQLKAARYPWWLAPIWTVVWCITWLPLGLWCYWFMLRFSDQVVKLIGYEGMSADQCDIRQSILRRRSRYNEARRCIRIALAKNPEKAHTRGLLRIGLAEIYEHEGNSFSLIEELWVATALANEAASQDPRQAARIYRHSARLMRKINPVLAEEWRNKARVLGEAAGAKDQLLKLE